MDLSFFDRSEAIRLLSYGIRFQVPNLANAFQGQAGRFVVGWILGLRPLALFYDLAARLAQPLAMFPALP